MNIPSIVELAGVFENPGGALVLHGVFVPIQHVSIEPHEALFVPLFTQETMWDVTVHL